MTGIFRRRDTATDSPSPSDGIVGVARVDGRTKDLIGYLQPGEIAVIDHEDLDRIAAEGLVRCQPAAVLNAAESSTGRYPNEGPLVLLEAGIPLVDELGPDLFGRVADGERVASSAREALLDSKASEDQAQARQGAGRDRLAQHHSNRQQREKGRREGNVAHARRVR